MTVPPYCHRFSVAIRRRIKLRNTFRSLRVGVRSCRETIKEARRFVLRTPSWMIDQRTEFSTCEQVEAANGRVLHGVQRVCAGRASGFGFWWRFARHFRPDIWRIGERSYSG